MAIRLRWLTIGVCARRSRIVRLAHRPAASSARSSCRTWTKAPSGPAARWRPAPVRREGTRVMNRARVILASFPEVTQVVSQIGRPDDGTDTTGFFNTEYFIDLKPKEEWRPSFHQDKEELIGGHGPRTGEDPWSALEFLAAHRRQHGRSGERRQRPTRDQDLRRRSEDAGSKGDEIVRVMRTVPGVADLGLFRVIGQPNLEFVVDRAECRPLRHQRGRCAGRHRNRGGRQGGQPGAAGRAALRPGGALPRIRPQTPKEAIENIRLLPPYRRARVAGPALRRQGAGRRVRNLPRRELALRRDQVQRAGPRPGQHGGRGDAQGQHAGEAAAGLPHRLGRRVRERQAVAEAAR